MARTFIYSIMLMILSQNLASQTNSALLTPTEPDGSVSLELSELLPENVNTHPERFFQVYVNHDHNAHLELAIQGTYSLNGNALSFSPIYPFDLGITYTVKYRSSLATEDFLIQSFIIGENQIVTSPEVLNIYPTGEFLPENLLRFYIYFNNPMEKGYANTFIQLTNAKGDVDSNAFMEFKDELWSANGKRLTLLFDPGRIKQGVSTHSELGPPLLEGNNYKLTISASWQDVYGQKLSENTIKKIEAVHAYRDKINHNDWTILEPEANSKLPLEIHFDRMMDHALIRSMIRISKKDETSVCGFWDFSDHEHSAYFIPEENWVTGDYIITIDRNLEDITGNNLHGLMDTFGKEKTQKSISDLKIPFNIR